MNENDLTWITKNINYSDFLNPINRTELIATASIHCKGQAKNGKWYPISVSCAIVLSELDQRKNKDNLIPLKEAKKEMARYSIMEYLHSLIEKRIGIKQHRGYFRIQELQPL